MNRRRTPAERKVFFATDETRMKPRTDAGNGVTDESPTTAPASDLPLPSMGRGNEGEGWANPRRPNAPFPTKKGSAERPHIVDTWRMPRTFPPLTPTLSPLRGEGVGSARRITNLHRSRRREEADRTHGRVRILRSQDGNLPPFSLTPALSRRERGKRSQRWLGVHTLGTAKRVHSCPLSQRERVRVRENGRSHQSPTDSPTNPNPAASRVITLHP